MNTAVANGVEEVAYASTLAGAGEALRRDHVFSLSDDVPEGHLKK
jgi:hypothetical protein